MRKLSTDRRASDIWPLAILILAVFLLYPSSIVFGGRDAIQRVEVAAVDQNPAHPRTGGFRVENISYAKGQDFLTCVDTGWSEQPIHVKVIHDDHPEAGVVVYFSVIESPNNRATPESLSQTSAVTDKDGMAQVNFRATDGVGAYLVEAMIMRDGAILASTFVRVHVRGSNWLIGLLVGLFGGLALFLYGMDQAGSNLKKVAGDRFRAMLRTLTRNQYVGALLGMVITFLLQSSSASTVMLVGLVSAAFLTLSQAIGVIVGAKLGTTLTVQIISFNVAQYALGIIAIGLLIKTVGQYKQIQRIGKVIMGFGFIFFGMGLMSKSMSPMRTEPEFVALMLELGKSPMLAIAFSVLFTSVIQSSSATIGVAMALASQGLLTLTGTLALAMGSSIGTCATAFLAAIGAARTGKQVALAHFLYSVIAVALALPFMDYIVTWTQRLSALMGETDIMRQTANGFTLFTLVTGLILLPFSPLIAKLTAKLLPIGKEDLPFGPIYLQPSSIAFPELAIEQAFRETMRMVELLRQQFVGIGLLINNPSERRCYELAEKDDQIDTLERAIRPFLAEVGGNEMDNKLAARERAIIFVADALEYMGDIIVHGLLHALEKMAQKRIEFSDEGKKELNGYLAYVITRFDRLKQAVDEQDMDRARAIFEETENDEWKARRIRSNHLERLHKGLSESLESSEAHLSVVGALVNINRRIGDIARIVADELN